MKTPKEWIAGDFPESGEIWINALDLIEHCLQGDANQSFFKNQSPVESTFREWQEAMQERAKIDQEFQQIFDNSYLPKPKWAAYPETSGDLLVDAYIAGENLVFESFEKRERQKQAISIIYDGCVPGGERSDSYMKRRHQKVYDIAAQAEAENRPCRVIAAHCIQIPESKELIKLFAVIKDYFDPIFPSIWGTYTTNRYTNSWCNVFMDYFVGTRAWNNGSVRELKNTRQYFPDDEELILYGDRIKE